MVGRVSLQNEKSAKFILDDGDDDDEDAADDDGVHEVRERERERETRRAS